MASTLEGCTARIFTGALGLALITLAEANADGPKAKGRPPRSCSTTTAYANHGCRFEALAEYNVALGKCENLAEFEDRSACRREARAALREELESCREQFEARRELCAELGQDLYDPPIDPDDFVPEVTNTFYPLPVGQKRIYEAEDEDGTERIEIEVLSEKKDILGVACTAVRDQEFLDDELVEDTIDFFAQDKDGNVWYFGEETMELEEGVVVSIEGAWKAGEDGAKPGIIMKANPKVGDVYRQEFLLGEAEDAARVVALDQKVSVPAGDFEGCLETEDFTPLEPDALEHKFYAPGVGTVLEVNVESGKRTELVSVDG
jgi:hypothetical protein